jgi:hypothetical protein
MLAFRRQLPASSAFALALLAALVLATQAAALSVPLTSDLGGVQPDAEYATVAVTQNGEDLDFSIVLGGLLGPREDAQRFYFSLLGDFTGLEILSSNAPVTEYRVKANPRLPGGEDGSFDFVVKLGHGNGRRGNGVLTHAIFTLSADQPLSPSDLFEAPLARAAMGGMGIESEMALHIEGTRTRHRSETVGGSAPEPSTALLLVTGLVALALRRQQRRR